MISKRHLRPLTRAFALAGALSLAACTSTETVGSLPSPVPAGSVALPSSSSSVSPVEGQPSTAPSGATSVAPVIPLPSPDPNSMSGNSNANVTTPDGQQLNLAFVAMDPYSFYGGPGSNSTLTFLDQGANSLTIGGYVGKGSYKTSADLGLSLTILSAGKPINLTSGNGSCRITYTQVDKKVVAGSFKCPDVKLGKNQTMDANGTFTGQAPATAG